MELCGVNALNFAVGAYLPLSTTLPIFAGGVIKRFVDWRARRKGDTAEDNELGRGSLFATGLVAGGALAGVIVALLSINESIFAGLERISAGPALSRLLGEGGYEILGALFFAFMGFVLFRIATRKAS
jgi:hypothetical protein